MRFKQNTEYSLISECGRYKIAKMNTGTETKYLAFYRDDAIGEAVASWQEARDILIAFDKGEL